MTLQQTLEQYCIARSMRMSAEQVTLANALVDEHIPLLIERLGQVMIERNAAQDMMLNDPRSTV